MLVPHKGGNPITLEQAIKAVQQLQHRRGVGAVLARLHDSPAASETWSSVISHLSADYWTHYIFVSMYNAGLQALLLYRCFQTVAKSRISHHSVYHFVTKIAWYPIRFNFRTHRIYQITAHVSNFEINSRMLVKW